MKLIQRRQVACQKNKSVKKNKVIILVMTTTRVESTAEKIPRGRMILQTPTGMTSRRKQRRICQRTTTCWTPMMVIPTRILPRVQAALLSVSHWEWILQSIHWRQRTMITQNQLKDSCEYDRNKNLYNVLYIAQQIINSVNYRLY